MEKIVGRLTGNATTKTWNDRVVINFTVAENRRYRDSNGDQQTKTRFVDCAYWTKTGKLAEFLHKGVLVEVDGTMGAHAYIRDKGKPTAEAVSVLTMDVDQLQLHLAPKQAQATE